MCVCVCLCVFACVCVCAVCLYVSTRWASPAHECLREYKYTCIYNVCMNTHEKNHKQTRIHDDARSGADCYYDMTTRRTCWRDDFGGCILRLHMATGPHHLPLFCAFIHVCTSSSSILLVIDCGSKWQWREQCMRGANSACMARTVHAHAQLCP